jgi:hypothetical protein
VLWLERVGTSVLEVLACASTRLMLLLATVSRSPGAKHNRAPILQVHLSEAVDMLHGKFMRLPSTKRERPQEVPSHAPTALALLVAVLLQANASTWRHSKRGTAVCIGRQSQHASLCYSRTTAI